MKIGKAYASRKKKEDRPKGDLYHTPRSLIWVVKDVIKKEFRHRELLEPCSGLFPISQELEKMGFLVWNNDLYTENADYNLDYLDQDELDDIRHIITNPPFSLFDKFVVKAKTHCRKFMFLGKIDFFSAHKRNETGLWKNLKAVYIFDRKVDLQTPLRDDGLFHVGMANHCWMLWDMKYKGKPQINIVDVQEFAKLGPLLKRKKDAIT